MKVILLADVKSVGKKDDIVEVSDGYARNMLLPKKLAAAATANNIKDINLKKKNEARIAKEEEDAARDFAAKLAEMSVTIPIKVGSAGRTFGSVSTKEIAEAVKSQLGIDIDKRKILLASPIKEIGTSKVPVKVHPKVTGELNVVVKAEE